MAYAAIISLKLTLQQNILLHPHRYTIPCEKKDIESLYEKFEFLQRFLEEYPSHEGNENVASLERRIRDTATEAEDFIDLHLNNLFDSKYFFIKATNFFRHIVAAFKNDTSRCIKLIEKVDSIVGEVVKIEEQMEIKQGKVSFREEQIKTDKFGEHKDFEPRNAFHKDSSKFVSSDTKSLMVGFDDHLTQIKGQLTGPSYALEVTSILGMGGIGKTTLATHVYNDPYVVNHFDIRSWANVSQSYRVRDILLGILDSMKKLTKEMHRERDDQLRLHVYHNLKHRRYLIIIDDIWDTNAWDCLKMMFPDDKTESRIMLTTRNAEVAAYASPSGNLHQIPLLSDDQSWVLLCAKVFADKPCPLNLQEIGKTIAHNCQGLPLSIVVIAGLLSKVEKTQMAWQAIAENITSFVFSSDDQCSDMLRLSYNYLPPYLKACFLYLGVFPKNYEIHVSKLTKMWVAEGFLRQAHGLSSEEVGERCVEDLLGRSLILMSKKNSEGKIKTFRIHDLLLDFCLKEAKNEKFLQIAKRHAGLSRPGLASERRISIHPAKVFQSILFPYDYMSCTSYVRSLICVGPCYIGSSVFLRFKLLRVLDVAQVEFLQFPGQVLMLLNLRYIALTWNGDIPALIAKLWNLQTLIVLQNSSGYSKRHLPVEIWTMAHLTHITCDGALLFNPTAAKFGFYGRHLVLEELQTLSGLCNLKFTKEILQSIPNIKKIKVLYESECVVKKEWSEYQLENLGNLHQLKSLKIRVIPLRGIYENLISPTMFKFHFPPSLKKLTLGGVGIPWDNLEIIGSLPNLEVLKLIDHACLGTKWELNEEEFSELKVLVLQDLKLINWKADSNNFPSLERLIIRWCYGLVEIPSGMGESPTLTMIELDGCPDSVSVSANEILEKQLSYGNDGFQVIDVDSKESLSEHYKHVLRRGYGGNLPTICL